MIFTNVWEIIVLWQYEAIKEVTNTGLEVLFTLIDVEI